MRAPLSAVCVYAGSNPGRHPAFADAARDLGSLLAGRGIEVVYGGGRVGLMGILADAALAAGGQVTGVIPQALVDKEISHDGLSELVVVETMHERKLAMADRSQAFISLPGGVGTLEELFEALTWTQLGLHDKPVGLLDVNGFFGRLLGFLDDAVDSGFVRPVHRQILQTSDDAAVLLDQIAAWEPTPTHKWMEFDDK